MDMYDNTIFWCNAKAFYNFFTIINFDDVHAKVDNSNGNCNNTIYTIGSLQCRPIDGLTLLSGDGYPLMVVKPECPAYEHIKHADSISARTYINPRYINAEPDMRTHITMCAAIDIYTASDRHFSKYPTLTILQRRDTPYCNDKQLPDTNESNNLLTHYYDVHMGFIAGFTDDELQSNNIIKTNETIQIGENKYYRIPRSQHAKFYDRDDLIAS